MNIWTLNSSFKTCRCCAHSLLLREKIVSASSEHKHFSIRTQTRRVPQSAENTSASASQRESARTRERGQRSDAPGSIRVLVLERSPLARTDAVQPGVACERHVNEACVWSDEVRPVRVTHSVFLCRS